MIKISKRLQAIGNLVPDGSVLVDIGTDHGLLMIDLLKKGKIPYAYGIDIAKEPLNAARSNIEFHNLSDKISLQLADGLEKFNEKANCFVIAGMGGETIWNIITAYQFAINDCLILQANSKLSFLREQLLKSSFKIVEEVYLCDKSKDYILIKVIKTKDKQEYDLMDLEIGPVLRRKSDSDYIDYLKNREIYLRDFKVYNRDIEREHRMIGQYLKECLDESIQ